jgi:hypothetical protein
MQPNPFENRLQIQINASLFYCTPTTHDILLTKLLYQAIFATHPLGYLLHHHFLASSVNNSHNPNATGKKKYSTGILLELMAVFRPGIYRKIKITTNAKRMAGKRARFWVALLKMGGC